MMPLYLGLARILCIRPSLPCRSGQSHQGSPVTLRSCQVWRRLVTIFPGTLESPGPWQRPDGRPGVSAAGTSGMGRNGKQWNGNQILLGNTPEGHQFSFESPSGMGTNGKMWDKMGKIQSRFSRVSFSGTRQNQQSPTAPGTRPAVSPTKPRRKPVYLGKPSSARHLSRGGPR